MRPCNARDDGRCTRPLDRAASTADLAHDDGRSDRPLRPMIGRFDAWTTQECEQPFLIAGQPFCEMHDRGSFRWAARRLRQRSIHALDLACHHSLDADHGVDCDSEEVNPTTLKRDATTLALARVRVAVGARNDPLGAKLGLVTGGQVSASCWPNVGPCASRPTSMESQRAAAQC